MAWFTTDWSSSHHTVRCAQKSGDVISFIIVACRISSQLKWYKNYKNRLRLAKVIVKNKMSRFYGSPCVWWVLLKYVHEFARYKGEKRTHKQTDARTHVTTYNHARITSLLYASGGLLTGGGIEMQAGCQKRPWAPGNWLSRV